ncbi:MAG: hypothetical protein K2K78_02425 [Muribaculaceae bacterium]|nr:hypothetical protein [Muribaculaceae bacterium]
MKTTPTKYIHSRAAAIMLMIVAVCAAAARLSGTAVPQTPATVFPPPDTWLAPETVSFAVNIAANIAIAFTLLVINRTYRLMRSITGIFVGFFFFMLLAQPDALRYFSRGSFTALAVMLLTALLFSTYASPAATRSTYLLFMLLALAALFQYNIIFLMPVFILGTIQMKIFDLRAILAIVMGIVTPLWILLGFGIIPPDSISLPELRPVTPSPDHSEYITGLVTTAFTGVIGLLFTFANLIKVMSYNSARRAFNGFITLLFLATLILIVADHRNLPTYVPMLDIIAAYQAGHFFATRRYRLSYIPICVILAIYAAIAAIPINIP